MVALETVTDVGSVLTAAPDRVAVLALVGVAMWSAFHIARQNLGVVAFVAGARRQAPPTAWERRLLTATGLAGSIGVVGYAVDLDEVGLAGLGLPLRVAAVAVTVTAVLLALPRLWARRSDPVGCAFLAQALAFYIPVFLASGPALAVIGIAHALQYALFMVFLAAHDERPARRTSGGLGWTRLTTIVVVVTVSVGFARYLMVRSDLAVLVALSVAAAIIHYLMDAGIWRLREPDQRRYVADRFPFLDH